MVAIGVVNFKDFKTDKLSSPLDSEGNICGKDKDFEEYPYLFIYKFDEPYKSVCVKECPKFDYNQMRYNSNGKNKTKIDPVYFEDFLDAVESSNLISYLNSRKQP